MQKPSFLPSDLNVPDEVAEKLNHARKQHLFTLLDYKNSYLTENVYDTSSTSIRIYSLAC